MSSKALEAAALAVSPHLRYYGGINPDNDDVAESRSHAHSIARKTIAAYLSALVEDEEVVERVALAIANSARAEDDPAIIPGRMNQIKARAALRALTQEEKS